MTVYTVYAELEPYDVYFALQLTHVVVFTAAHVLLQVQRELLGHPRTATHRPQPAATPAELRVRRQLRVRGAAAAQDQIRARHPRPGAERAAAGQQVDDADDQLREASLLQQPRRPPGVRPPLAEILRQAAVLLQRVHAQGPAHLLQRVPVADALRGQEDVLLRRLRPAPAGGPEETLVQQRDRAGDRRTPSVLQHAED